MLLGLQLLKAAVHEVTSSEEFNLPTGQATLAVECAQCFMKWLAENEEDACKFAKQVHDKLVGCVKTPKSSTLRSIRSTRERIWENFFKLSSSEKYRQEWESQLDSIGCNVATPIFYQFITDKMFGALLKTNYAISDEGSSTTSSTALDYNEMNALRYSAG